MWIDLNFGFDLGFDVEAAFSSAEEAQ